MNIVTYTRKKNQKYKKILVGIGLFVLISSMVALAQYYQKSISAITKEKEVIPAPQEISKEAAPKTKSKPIASSAILSVPYAMQAPFSNWKVHEESCEEAALTMYHDFFEGFDDVILEEGPLDLTYKEMKSWQVTHYGKEPDLTMEALGKFAKEYYGHSYTTAEATETNIKQAITDGHPVVVPVMTHSLENSMYGPYTVYHVLLVKGYDTTGVITNDAGVGNGKDHHYDWNILWQAIDAQTPKMKQGRVMLTLSK